MSKPSQASYYIRKIKIPVCSRDISTVKLCQEPNISGDRVITWPNGERATRATNRLYFLDNNSLDGIWYRKGTKYDVRGICSLIKNSPYFFILDRTTASLLEEEIERYKKQKNKPSVVLELVKEEIERFREFIQ